MIISLDAHQMNSLDGNSLIKSAQQRKLQVVQDGASGTGPSGVGRSLYTDA